MDPGNEFDLNQGVGGGWGVARRLSQSPFPSSTGRSAYSQSTYGKSSLSGTRDRSTTFNGP